MRLIRGAHGDAEPEVQLLKGKVGARLVHYTKFGVVLIEGGGDFIHLDKWLSLGVTAPQRSSAGIPSSNKGQLDIPRALLEVVIGLGEVQQCQGGRCSSIDELELEGLQSEFPHVANYTHEGVKVLGILCAQNSSTQIAISGTVTTHLFICSEIDQKILWWW